MTPLLRLQSDDRLARLAASGHEPAFETLVRRHRRAVDTACRRVLPREGAEDAAQQAMLSAHQALVRNGPPDRFEPWLRQIALNAALKEIRQHDADTVPIDEESIDGVERPDEAHERRELLGRTIRAVSGLPPRQRRALVMRELEGRSHEEIAAALGLSRGAIRQLIHRAREGVRGVATALTPLALLRTGGAGTQTSGQVTEVAAGGLAAGFGTKAAVALLATGGIAGGVAFAPSHPGPDGRSDRSAGDEAAAIAGPEEASASDAGPGSRNSGPGSSRKRDRDGDSSGPGGGGDADAALDNSGPGSLNSGSGSSGSGSSGSGSSGSGSGSSGSGSSGSGSSGSGSSGSGSSGSDSGSSGSGSGSDPDLD